MDASRLKSIPLFEEVGDEELAQIAPFATEVVVEEGRELVREGDFSYEFMAIEEGEAEVTRGGEHVADLGPGDFFGEMGLLERTLRNATVTAKTPVRLVTLTGWDLKRVERSAPQAMERIRSVLEERRAGGLMATHRPVRRHRLHGPARRRRAWSSGGCGRCWRRAVASAWRRWPPSWAVSRPRSRTWPTPPACARWSSAATCW